MNWTFRADEMADATEFFRANGFVGFPDLLTASGAAALRDAAEVASYSDDKWPTITTRFSWFPFLSNSSRTGGCAAQRRAQTCASSSGLTAGGERRRRRPPSPANPPPSGRADGQTSSRSSAALD